MVNRRTPNKKEKEHSWNKAKKIKSKDPKKYRKDKSNNVIYKASYGKTSKMGWEVDHSKPLKKEGTYHPNNLQALHTSQNRSKGSKYRYNYAQADQKGQSLSDIAETNIDKRSTLVKQDHLHLNNDGTVDQRSKAVRNGSVRVNKNGKISKNSAAIQSGSVILKDGGK